jgi:hypothetical protein
VLDEQAWRRLREEAGVTYGAGAGAVEVRTAGDDAGYLFMNSLVQNDAVDLGVSTFFNLIERAAAGEFDPAAVATQKWSRGRSYVLGQQSQEAMLRRLFSVDAGRYEYFPTYRDALAAVDGKDFASVIAPCKGHEVVTIVGPRHYAEEHLKRLGVPFEVVDWQGRFEGSLTKKEIKDRAKAAIKKAKEEAKREASAGAS